jgi:Jacalin-like lectin domain
MQTRTQTIASGIQTKSFGGGGGNPFGKAVVEEIGLRAGEFVDQIRINNNIHGGDGGNDDGSITLNTDEYISKVEISAGEFVDRVRFITNEERSVGGGGGGNPTTLDGIRVLAIGGRAGEYVDNLNIMYIDGYQPSTVEARNVGFILAYSPPFEKFEEYTSSFYKTVDSYERVTEHMLSQKYSASVQGEYYVKVTASTEIEVKDTSLETVSRELQQELNSGSSKTQEIPETYVGIKLVNGTLMKGADGTFWMYPTSELSYSVIKASDFANVLDHYDLTGELYTQMPGLHSHKTVKNGYVFYSEQ